VGGGVVSSEGGGVNCDLRGQSNANKLILTAKKTAEVGTHHHPIIKKQAQTPPRRHTCQQPLSRRLFIPGGPIDLSSQVQPRHPPGLQAVRQLIGQYVAVLHCVCGRHHHRMDQSGDGFEH